MKLEHLYDMIKNYAKKPGDGKFLQMHKKSFNELFKREKGRKPVYGEELVIDGIRIKAV